MNAIVINVSEIMANNANVSIRDVLNLYNIPHNSHMELIIRPNVLEVDMDNEEEGELLIGNNEPEPVEHPINDEDIEFMFQIPEHEQEHDYDYYEPEDNNDYVVDDDNNDYDIIHQAVAHAYAAPARAVAAAPRAAPIRAVAGGGIALLPTDCSICLEILPTTAKGDKFHRSTCTTNCKHTFHKKCLMHINGD
jgi:hypothetical protein